MALDHIFETNDGQLAFEVRIYNQEVRQLVKDNRHHELFDDQWADCHRHGVYAVSEDEAKSIAEDRFPSSDGFVIEDILPRG